ncbi:hypothetical protein MRB53_042164 [Persea americana]|nr:hypothetical protein MRB53_042164 [Persea americana]
MQVERSAPPSAVNLIGNSHPDDASPQLAVEPLSPEAASSVNQPSASQQVVSGSTTASPVWTDFLHQPDVKIALPFLNGGLAGMVSTLATHPFDMVKVRMQLIGEGVKTGPKPTPWSVGRDIIQSGRALDLYSGLSAGLLRQAVYTTARMGLFDTFMAMLAYSADKKEREVKFHDRALASLSSGGLAAIIGCPTDVALVRMQTDGIKATPLRANYSSCFDALARIRRLEGYNGLWAGVYPTAVRGMAQNFGQLAFFSEAKYKLKDSALPPYAQTLIASAIGGFCASFFSLPFDFVKTRLQKQVRITDGLHYRGMLHCFQIVAREEGLLRFYRGFGTYCLRTAPGA